MILIDTSVWIDHLRISIPKVGRLIDKNDIIMHPFVVGEIAMGTPKNRTAILMSLNDFPQVRPLLDEEVLDFVTKYSLFGLGISYIDAHLLASVMLEDEALLWTRDKRLHDVAHRLGLAMIETGPFLN